MSHRSQGFTLIESTLSLTVVGILACIAIPAWSNASEAAHSGSAQAAISITVLAAIRHSALTGSEVVICPGDANGCRGSIDWSDGWIAFPDFDRDRIRDADEALLNASAALGGKAHLRSTAGRTRLVFHPNGGNVGSNVTFTLCDGRGTGKARQLVLANDGRLRVGTPTQTAALACLAVM